MRALKHLLFRLLRKDPEAVVISFATGPAEQVRSMVEEIRSLEPLRRHFLVCAGRPLEVEGVTTITLVGAPAWGMWRQLRRHFRPYRTGLAPVLFSGGRHPLRAAAVLFAPGRILAYNSRLERHHLRFSSCIASGLFLRGVPLDRIYLRPRWLIPWSKDRTRPAERYRIIEGRAAAPERRGTGILSPYFPYPLSHGGAVRIFHLMREAARDFDIYLFAFSGPVADADIEPVRALAARIVLMELPRYREPRWASLDPPEVREFRSPVLEGLIARTRKEWGIELMQVEYTHLARYDGDVLVEHDVTWDLYQQLHSQRRTISSWWDLLRWRRFERRAVRRFPRLVLMSEKDRGLLGAPHARVIPNGVDLERFTPTPEPPGQNLLFVGSFRHFPNILAFRFLTEEVWPLLEARCPGAHLTVVAGPDPLTYWKAATNAPPPAASGNIRILDFVRDVKPLYQQANVVVVPTPVSAGTNLKVLEAMAMERAVVSTRCGCEGLGLEDGESVLIADNAASFAGAVARLLEDPLLRGRIASAARAVALRDFDWRVLGRLQRALWEEMLPARLKIRSASADDLSVVLEIQNASPGAARWEPAAYLNYHFYIAHYDGRPAGFIVWRHTSADETEIMNIAVKPELRRLGIASRLLDRARQQCPGALFLEVRVSNHAAIALYRKHGFREAGIRKEYYSTPPEDAIVMRL
jgi:ribosomal-protein-alanine acetyltransferase